jgi:hypothetical protein
MSKYSLQKKKIEYKYSEQVAIDQLILLLDYYNIDIDKIDTERKKSIENTCDELTLFIREGLLEIKKDEKDILKVTQIKSDGNRVEWDEMSGKHRAQIGSLIGNEGYPMMYKLAGSMTNLGELAIQNFKGKDLQIVEALSLIFLSA